MNLNEYYRRKERYLNLVKKDTLHPFTAAEIIGVPHSVFRSFEREICGTDNHKYMFHDYFTSKLSTTVGELEDYGLKKLRSVCYISDIMNYFFVMDNDKAIRVMHGEIASKRGRKIVENIIQVFEKRAIPTFGKWNENMTRFDILDL